MKFTAFKELKIAGGLNVVQLARYVTVELKSFLRDLQVGLTRLSFTDNFETFEATVTIAALSEVSIVNELQDIPSYRLFVRGGGGVEDGDTEWDTDFVHLKNTSASSVTVTAIFFR